MATTERTISYAAAVDSLSDAWSFVMAHLDELGDEPTIEIKPEHIFYIADAVEGIEREPIRQFGVRVSGMIVIESEGES